MTIIYLIRHSDSLKSKDMVYEKRYNEQLINEKLPLSVEGENKVFKISNMNELSDVDAVFSSEYERAISTAKYIANRNNLVINITSKLNERKLGNVKGVPKSFWLTQLEDENAKTAGGESRIEVCKRMSNLVERILKDYKDKKVVLVSHATAITFLLMKWCKLVSADLHNKSRHFTFNDKDVINDVFKCPEIFKIEFNNNDLINVELIREEE